MCMSNLKLLSNDCFLFAAERDERLPGSGGTSVPRYPRLPDRYHDT
jgi:hypothetical protein